MSTCYLYPTKNTLRDKKTHQLRVILRKFLFLIYCNLRFVNFHLSSRKISVVFFFRRNLSSEGRIRNNVNGLKGSSFTFFL